MYIHLIVAAFCAFFCVSCGGSNLNGTDGDFDADLDIAEQTDLARNEDEDEDEDGDGGSDGGETAEDDAVDHSDSECVCGPEVAPCCDGCHFRPEEYPCDDGRSSTEVDRCREGVCLGFAIVCLDALDGFPCDDGSSETVRDICSNQVCSGVPRACTAARVWLDCDDANPDTERDLCLPDGRCVGVGAAQSPGACSTGCRLSSYCVRSTDRSQSQCLALKKRGLGDGIQYVDSTKDGQLLAVAYSDRVEVRRTLDAAVVRWVVFPEETVTVTRLAPDGSTLAVGLCSALEDGRCTESRIVILNLALEQSLATEVTFVARFYAMAYSSDGKVLGAAGCVRSELGMCLDSAIHIIDPTTGRIQGTIPCIYESPTSLAFSIDGRYVVEQEDGDFGLFVYSVDSLEFERVIVPPNYEEHSQTWTMGDQFSILFSGDDSLIGEVGCIEITGGAYCHRSRAVLWNFNSGAWYKSYETDGAIARLIFNRDETQLIGIGTDRIVTWNVSGGTETSSFLLSLFSGAVIGSAFDLERGTAMLGRGYRDSLYSPTKPLQPTLDFVSIEDQSGVTVDTCPGTTIVSDDGYSAISRCWDYESFHRLVKWSVLTGTPVKEVEACGTEIVSIVDGKLFVNGCEDGSLRVLSAATLSLEKTLTGHQATVSALVVSQDGKWLGSADDAGTVNMWRTSDFQLERVAGTNFGRVHALAFSNGTDPHLFAAARCAETDEFNNCVSSDVVLFAWNADSQQWENYATIRDGVGVVWSISFSKDDRLLAFSDYSKIKVVNVETAEAKGIIDLSSARRIRLPVRFAPQGTWLYYGLGENSEDGRVLVWDAASVTEVWTLHPHKGGVVALDFTLDGSRLVTGSEDGSTLILDIPNVGSAPVARVGNTDPLTNSPWSEPGR